jgi:hypothetical protein
MSAFSWRVGFQRGGLALLATAVWLCGFALSAAVFCGYTRLMVIFGAGLMLAFIPWATITGLRFTDSHAIVKRPLRSSIEMN